MGLRGSFISEAWLQFGEWKQWSHTTMCQSWQPSGGVIQGWTCAPHPMSWSPEVCIQAVLLDVAAAHVGGPSELRLIAATLSFHRLGSDIWFIPRQGLVPIDRPVNALTRKVFLMNCVHRNQQIKARTENKLVFGGHQKGSKVLRQFLPIAMAVWCAIRNGLTEWYRKILICFL